MRPANDLSGMQGRPAGPYALWPERDLARRRSENRPALPQARQDWRDIA